MPNLRAMKRWGSPESSPQPTRLVEGFRADLAIDAHADDVVGVERNRFDHGVTLLGDLASGRIL